MLNCITIMGRLTRDPELRRTGSGTPVANFTVAVDRDFSGQNGDKETDFVDCVAWRQTGEFVSKYFKKGSMAVVSGRLQSRKWTDKDGNKRTAWEVLADRVYFGSSKKDSEDSSNNPYSGNSYGNSYGGYEESMAQVSKYSGVQQDFNYPYLGGQQQPDDFAILDDDDAQLPF